MATLNIHPVTDLTLPELKAYCTLRRRQDLRRERTFVAEGDKVVCRLLESGLPVLSLLITERWLEKIDALLARKEGVIDVHVASLEQIEHITGFECYQGIKAIGRVDHIPALEEVMQRSPGPKLFVALDGLNNAENLGVIVRNAVAMGVQAVIHAEDCASPFLTRAIRVSMGGVFKLPVVESPSLVDTLKALKQAGVHLVAAHPHTDQRMLSQADFNRDVCIVLGNEGYGISQAALDVCHEHVVIPMQSEVDSLNVGSASAAFFYEAARQRGLA